MDADHRFHHRDGAAREVRDTVIKTHSLTYLGHWLGTV